MNKLIEQLKEAISESEKDMIVKQMLYLQEDETDKREFQ